MPSQFPITNFEKGSYDSTSSNQDTVRSSSAKISNNCKNENNLRDLEKCLQIEFEKSDKVLGELVDSIKTGLIEIPLYQANLEDAQKAWVLYKIRNCKAEKELYGEGSEALSASISCQLNLTIERITELHRIYDRR